MQTDLVQVLNSEATQPLEQLVRGIGEFSATGHLDVKTVCFSRSCAAMSVVNTRKS